MKTKVFLIGLMSFFAFQLNAQNIFEKLAKEEQVTTVRITKSILRMMPEFSAEANFDGIKIGALASKLDLLEVYTTEKPELMKFMKDAQAEFAKNPGFEEIMRVKNERSEAGFFVERKNKNDEALKSFFMFVNNDGRSVIMCLQGNFTMEDIKGVVASAAAN